MEITKEQIRKLYHLSGFKSEVQNNLEQWFPECFEPEYKRVFLWNRKSQNGVSQIIDTGRWEIFDCENEFYIVDKNNNNFMLRFLKYMSGYYNVNSNDRFYKFYKSRK